MNYEKYQYEPKYPYEPISRKLHGKKIKLIGVKHNLDFYDKHSNFFSNEIHEADAVFLEQPISIEFWYAGFYRMLGLEAKKFNKKVYQADPRNKISHYIVDKYVQPAAYLTLLVGGYLNEKKRQKKHSRRELLKIGAKMFGAASLMYGSMRGIDLRMKLSEKDVYEYGFDDLFTYGEFDYSNVKIADGLDKVSASIKGIEKIVAFHGALHTDSIRAYIDNPYLREVKKAYYFPYEAVGIPLVREYTPISKGWAMTKAI